MRPRLVGMEAARRALEEAGVEQVVQYDQIQFTKSPEVLQGMGLELGKTDEALAELREKGLAA